MIIKGKNIKTAYFIGIKGVGMTMLAQFLVESGVKITGSDIPEKFMTDQVLKREKIKVRAPFAVDNIPAQVDLIVHSSAFSPKNNVEMKYLEQKKRSLGKCQLNLSYAEALGAVFSQYYGLAVCGSHGKTTTSAWLGFVLDRAGLKPNVLVGARVPQFKGSALKGASRYFVAETDEYQNKLQYFFPTGVVLNNIDYDHPDFFKTRKDYFQVFAAFVKKIPAKGFLAVNADDPLALKAAARCRGRVITYSLKNKKADYGATDFSVKNGRQHFLVWEKGKSLGSFSIRLAGEHNIANALAVIATAKRLKLDLAVIKKYLTAFGGTERRLQVLGKYKGALIVDDYAHHPTEIRATLAGLRKFYPQRRIVTVFHPHTFSRTKAFLADFAASFSGTDELLVLDIYGSAREKQGGVSSQKLIALMGKHSPHLNIKYLPLLDLAADYLAANIHPNDVVLLMGAGDVFRIGEKLLHPKK